MFCFKKLLSILSVNWATTFDLIIKTKQKYYHTEIIKTNKTAIMKVVANLIRHFSIKKPSDEDEEDDKDDPDVIKMKIVFLSDLVKLFESSKENRRVLLQQSVWQDWLVAFLLQTKFIKLLLSLRTVLKIALNN